MLDTAWLDRLTATESFVPTRHADVAIVAAAIDAYDEAEVLELARFFESAARGRPYARDELGVEVELRHNGRAYRLIVGLSERDKYRVRIDGHALIVDVERLGRLRRRLTVGDRSFRVVASTNGTDHLVDVDGVAHRISRDDGGVLRAPAAALVVAVNVQPDTVVAAGRSGRGRRGDEDGDRHHRPDERPGARGAGDAQRAGRCRRPTAAHREAGDRRRRRDHRRGHLVRRAGRRGDRRRAGRATSNASCCCAPSCSATTPSRPRRGGWSPITSPTGQRRCTARTPSSTSPSWACCRPSPTWARSLATGGETRATTTSRAARASSSTRTCAPSAATRRACRIASAAGWSTRSPTTASAISNRRPS